MNQTRMFPFVLFSAFLILPAILSAGSEDESKALYEQIYTKALSDLESGSSEEKILATYRFGASQNKRYVRPLTRELLHNLDSPNFRRLPVNDPYVKSQIAWAIGSIGDKQALPDLNKALQLSVKIVEDDIRQSSEKRKSLEQKKEIYPVVLDHDRPGPARLKPGFRYPDSPDVYWSVADSFKAEGGYNPEREDHRIRREGYNYINLVQNIMNAMGEISGKYSKIIPTGKAGEPLKKLLSDTRATLQSYLVHPIPSIRGSAVLALGKMYSKESMELLEKRYPEEKDFVVKTQILRAVLWNDRSKTDLTRDLVEMLSSEDVFVRLEAARALRDVALGETIPYLEKALQIEDDMRVRSILNEAIYFAQVDNILPVNY